MYGEKSAIICCHLSYLLMDDNGKKNNQKFPIDLIEKCIDLDNLRRNLLK